VGDGDAVDVEVDVVDVDADVVEGGVVDVDVDVDVCAGSTSRKTCFAAVRVLATVGATRLPRWTAAALRLGPTRDDKLDTTTCGAISACICNDAEERSFGLPTTKFKSTRRQRDAHTF